MILLLYHYQELTRIGGQMNEAVTSQKGPPEFVQLPNLQNQPRPALHARRGEVHVDGVVPHVGGFDDASVSVAGEKTRRGVLRLAFTISLQEGPGFAPFQVPERRVE